MRSAVLPSAIRPLTRREFVLASRAPSKSRGRLLGRLGFALVCLIAFAIPWENVLVIPEVGTISRLFGLGTLPVAVFAIVNSGRLRMPSMPLLLMGAFVAWGSLTYWWTVNTESTTTLIDTWLQCLGMVWLIWELAPERERQLALARAYVMGTLVSSGDTIVSYWSGSSRLWERYAATGFDPNDLGLLLALSLPISFYLATIQRGSSVVWIYRLQQIAAIVAIGLTSSRAALICTVVALSYLPFASLKMTLRQKCAFFLMGVVAISSAVAFLPQTSWKRLEGTSTELGEGTLGERRLIWSAGFEVFREHPILGIGAGGFPTSTGRFLPRGEVAHNTFLSVLVEEGLVGLVILLLLLLTLTVPALQMPAPERTLWLVLLATWVVGVNSLTWEPRKSTWFFFALIAARVCDVAAVRRKTGAPFLRRAPVGRLAILTH